MDQSSLRGGGGHEIDLEYGGTVGNDNGGKKSNVCGGISKNHKLYRVWSRLAGRQLSETSGKCGRSFISLAKSSSFRESFVVKNEEKLPSKVKEPKGAGLAEKKIACKLPKKPESTRPSKPPRPPRGPSLDAADMMLVKEISELAILKRKRIERMKTLRKVKREKPSSINSSLFAMVVTILFLVVIIFQGNTFFSS